MFVYLDGHGVGSLTANSFTKRRKKEEKIPNPVLSRCSKLRHLVIGLGLGALKSPETSHASTPASAVSGLQRNQPVSQPGQFIHFSAPRGDQEEFRLRLTRTPPAGQESDLQAIVPITAKMDIRTGRSLRFPGGRWCPSASTITTQYLPLPLEWLLCRVFA